MTLEQLWQKTVAAVSQCYVDQVDPREVPVVVSTPTNYREDVGTAELEEFPDDEETYREHRRCGGKKEYSFLLETVEEWS